MSVPDIDNIINAPSALYRQIERSIGGWYVGRYFEGCAMHPALDPLAARQAVAQADRIVFLCLGNICRSPFAERYTERHLMDQLDVTCISAGLSPLEGRSSPAEAVETAAAYDVDLRTHASTPASRVDWRENDVVFVMDHANYYLVASHYSSLRDRTFYLGSCALGQDDCVIPDPNGEDTDTFEATYATIAEALDNISGNETTPSIL